MTNKTDATHLYTLHKITLINPKCSQNIAKNLWHLITPVDKQYRQFSYKYPNLVILLNHASWETILNFKTFLNLSRGRAHWTRVIINKINWILENNLIKILIVTGYKNIRKFIKSHTFTKFSFFFHGKNNVECTCWVASGRPRINYFFWK